MTNDGGNDHLRDEREKILEAYRDLRVADVRDGMDFLLLHSRGSMNPDIRPLRRTRAFGIAKTCKYIQYTGKIPRMNETEYMEWSNMYYRDINPYPWIDEIGEGDFIVIDQSGLNAGLMGSENTLTCIRKGASGFVTNGGVRDTDEIILNNVPFWSRIISQCMVQGRLEYKTHNVPVTVGDILVNPGDIVVADGDGVIVVPRDAALKVAYLAHEEHERDKKRRGEHYRALGWEMDNTLK